MAAIDGGRRGHTRAGFLAGVGGVAGLAALAAPAAAAPAGDVAILRYALTLEQLTAAFYTEAAEGGALGGDAARLARTLAQHEQSHVEAIQDALGGAGGAAPAFRFGDATADEGTFLETAVTLEDLSVAAYAGQAPKVRSRQVLAAALGIHAVEARHASWARYVAGVDPASRPYDPARGARQVLAAVQATGFLVEQPTMTSSETPPFQG
jgi:hypothetical protein